MQDRDLIVCVLAARAGFATPSEVPSAAAAGLVDSAPDSLLTRLKSFRPPEARWSVLLCNGRSGDLALYCRCAS